MTIINEEKKYRELKESITMANSEGSDVEKINLIKKSKNIGINEVVKRIEVINNSLTILSPGHFCPRKINPYNSSFIQS